MRNRSRTARALIRVLTPAGARAIDRLCVSRYGISTLVLMENASVQVAGAALGLAGGVSKPRVLVVAGKGNNGGDALAAARHLANAGARVCVLLIGAEAGLTADAAAQAKTCRAMRIPLCRARSPIDASLGRAISHLGRGSPGVIVDGLFGTGLSRAPGGVAREAIDAMNRLGDAGWKIVAVDIPSGVDGGSGRIRGAAVKADMTVTFVALKAGMLSPEAIERVGRVAIAEIGVPRTLLDRFSKPVGVAKARSRARRG